MKSFLNLELQKEGRDGRMVVWDLTDKEQEQMEKIFTVGKLNGRGVRAWKHLASNLLLAGPTAPLCGATALNCRRPSS